MRDEPITKEVARSRIANLLACEGFQEEAKKMANTDWLHIEFTNGIWADSGELYVKESYAGLIGEGTERQQTLTYVVQVNWSSTHRSVANALTALANYQKAIELAAKVEALVEKFPTVVYEEIK